jgi:subtilisin-like proprotein convertase family protein
LFNTIQITFDRGVSPGTLTASNFGLIGPPGHVAITGVSAVARSGNLTFNISFATQSAPGTYTLYLGSSPRDLAGNPIAAYSGQFKLVAAPTPTHVISSTASGPSANTLNSIQVTFNEGVSPSTFTADDVGLTGPPGHVAVTGVTVVPGTDNRTFKISFATQTRAGTYTLYLGTTLRDLAGNATAGYQGAYKIAPSTTPPPPTSGSASFTSNNSVAIPSGGRGVSLLTINQNLTIAHISVKLNITYPQVGDLFVHLTAPDGTDIVLTQQIGGTTANFPGTTFDDGARQSIAFAMPPYTGSYQPLTALSYLNGKSTQGTWKLWVENRGTLRGTVNSWTINVKAG